MIHVDVIGHVTFRQASGLQHDSQLLGTVADFYHVAFLDPIARDVDLFAVHLDVAVVHELTRSKDRRHELGAVDDGVQATLQQTNQVLTSVAFNPLSLSKDAAELLFGQVTIMTLQLLLGAQLQTKVAELALAALAMLAGAIVTAVDRGFRTTPNVFAHPAVEFVLGRGAFCHRLISSNNEGVVL